MCGVKRSAVKQLRQQKQLLIGDATEKQVKLIAGILDESEQKIKEMHLPKFIASVIIDKVASTPDTPSHDLAQAGPYGVYDPQTHHTFKTIEL